MTNPVLDAIRSRRMTRAMIDRPIERDRLEAILEAARWAPNAGNRRLHRFVAVQDPVTLRVLRAVSPGMFQHPVGAIVVCIDWSRAVSFGMRPGVRGPYIDVGTLAQTMLLAAHSLGVGSGIVTSFSQAAVAAALELPGDMSPELIVCLGYAAAAQPAPMRARSPVTWQTLTDWERFPGRR